MSLALSTVACSDMMDESSPNQMRPVDFYETLDDTDRSLTSTYNALYNHNVLSIEASTLCSDMGYPGYGRIGNPKNLTLASYYNQSYSNSADFITNKWSALYTGVFRANQTIEALDYVVSLGNATVESDEYIRQMSQARFLRGLYHFYLHTIFNKGNIIYFDFVPEGDEFYQPLTDSDTVIANIREDLQYAYANLPAKYDNVKDLGRVTKGAAATILALSYIYNDDGSGACWNDAMPILEDIINNYDYKLASADVLFTAAHGEHTSESIFEICYSAKLKPELNENEEHSLTNRLGITCTTGSFTLSAWLLNAYQEEYKEIDDTNVINKVMNDDGTTRLRTGATRRHSAMIASVTDEDTPYYLNPSTTSKVIVSDKTAVGYYRKYTNWDIVSDETDAGEGKKKSGKNVVVNRLSEIYLLYAEGLLKRDNDVAGALVYINKIRTRWGLKPLVETDYTAATLMDRIMYIEKPLELSAEGHFIRFVDLRRWGIMKSNFEKLATEVYYLHTYDPILPSLKTKKKAHLKPESEGTTTFKIEDYREAASNFNDSKAWWPIPLVEEQNNPNLYK